MYIYTRKSYIYDALTYTVTHIKQIRNKCLIQLYQCMGLDTAQFTTMYIDNQIVDLKDLLWEDRLSCDAITIVVD